MANREPIQYVEIDVDRCSRTFGVSPCLASIGTNSFLRSEEINNSVWAKTGVNGTITTNTIAFYDGRVVADSWVESSTASVPRFMAQSASVVAGTAYTFSFFAKSLGVGSTRYLALVLTSALFGSNASAVFTTSGSGSYSIVGTGTNTSAGIQNVGNGWYRCWIKSDAVTTGTSSPRLYLTPNTTSIPSYTGDGISGLYICGGSFNSGSLSAYARTEGSAVTSTTGTRKCFNTFATCQYKSAFNKTVDTLTFVNNRANTPVGLQAYPVLLDRGVSAFSSTVNIAGSDPRMSAFGRRATVTVNLQDFVDSDSAFDKYFTQRINGMAQADNVGYNPKDYGTFFTRLKARWPYYAGRPVRVVDGFVDGGVLTIDQTRHFIITNIAGPDSNGKVTIEGKDVLALADDKKALAPKPSRGKLGSDIDLVATAFNLTPSGIGTEYPASGYATIGSEVVSYTRSTDTITLTGRGLKGTVASTHSLGDSFQEAINLESARIDDTIYDLLVTYAKVDPSFCPKTTEWEPEITRWMSSVLLDTVITKPTGVSQLLGELADLGISIWWDDVNQKIKILANHPVGSAAITDISDRNNIKKIEQEDQDEDRITQVHFYTKQSDPTKDYKDKSNYDQIQVIVDTTAEGVNAYNDTKVREVFCRWLNNGADAVVRVQALRLLQRFNTPPVHYTITLDTQDRDLGLTDVLRLDSRVSTDEAGFPVQRLLQVFRKEETRFGHELKVSAQAFIYEGRYGYIMPNGSPVYGSATETQKATGAFFVSGSTLVFPDGTGPYVFI